MKPTLLKFAATAALGLALAAPAQAFPTQPVKIIVPQTPGGASDTLARVIAQKLAEKWGQPVVVENRAGAGGNIGMEGVARAAPDGHTLLMSYSGTHAINGALYKKLPFDPVKDFEPVATLATLPFVIVARSGAKHGSVADVIAAARSGPLTYGSAGNGSVNHLLGVMFGQAAGIQLTHVPYRGAAPAMQDLLAGQIDLVFTSLPSVSGAIKQGSLRPIALTSRERAAAFGNIPSIAEAGFKDFDVNPWFGLFAPAGTPSAVIRKINADVNELLKSPEVVEKFTGQGAVPFASDPQQFGAVLREDITKWSGVVKSSGASLD